jgi:hypothetical protein
LKDRRRETTEAQAEPLQHRISISTQLVSRELSTGRLTQNCLHRPDVLQPFEYSGLQTRKHRFRFTFALGICDIRRILV